MKSIEDTLNLVRAAVDSLSDRDDVQIALIGGYAAISYGVPRTSVDVDFCVYSRSIHEKGPDVFADRLRSALPTGFIITLTEGTRMLDDPFKHDVISIDDPSFEYPHIDIIIAKYQWELEGVKAASCPADLPFPVMPKPYLIGMKLRAGGFKDDYDVSELYQSLTEEEKAATHDLAARIHRDRKLADLLGRSRQSSEDDDTSGLITR